jgi:hypothetical protein
MKAKERIMKTMYLLGAVVMLTGCVGDVYEGPLLDSSAPDTNQQDVTQTQDGSTQDGSTQDVQSGQDSSTQDVVSNDSSSNDAGADVVVVDASDSGIVDAAADAPPLYDGSVDSGLAPGYWCTAGSDCAYNVEKTCYTTCLGMSFKYCECQKPANCTCL